jgi:hypothetical protein
VAFGAGKPIKLRRMKPVRAVRRSMVVRVVLVIAVVVVISRIHQICLFT